MAYVALIIAVLALIGAGVLLYLGKKNAEQISQTAAPHAEALDPTPSQEFPQVENEILKRDDAHHADSQLDNEHEPELVEERDPAREPEPAPEHDPEPAPEHDPEPAPEHDPEPTSAPRPKPPPRPMRRSGLQLPGSTRRERRGWAEQREFEFRRTDEYLIDEWSRGAAATGAAPKDIVHGFVYGHEMLLMDLGGVNTMAMRTGVSSDVVVDMRRDGFHTSPSHDLLEVMHIEGFTVYATEVGPAERMIDDRVITALENLPEVVSAVWFESDWVLAQTQRGSAPEDWDEMLAPLGLLADAARVLPPQTWQTLEFDHPTREMSEPVFIRTESQPEHEADVLPNVVRPEEPLEMPTRTTGAVRGVMVPHAIGGDEVEAIADGREETTVNDGTRVARENKPPSIFDDEAQGLGHEQTGHEQAGHEQ
ncbi:hypothetical protein [Corynebacterium cystitidis]|uniref:hypothetical protein n=1 Tax=Corynebacterium cystitidis TaxID=35757 RepID=UPI00211E8270|nr:hypothetical protein [Corynebacterium cystitidis]